MGRMEDGEKFTENSRSRLRHYAPDKLKPKSKIEKKKKKKFAVASNLSSLNNDDHGNENLSLENNDGTTVQEVTTAKRLSFFLDMFQSANGVRLSSLELESLNDGCNVDFPQNTGDDDNNLANHLKAALGSSWKDILCGEQILEGKMDPGSPAVLIVSSSALRSIELLRGLRSLTKTCHAVKLFSKHMKIDEQSLGNDDMISMIYKGISYAEFNNLHFYENVGMMTRFKRINKGVISAEFDNCTSVLLLKSRVNIACGTPNRIKKLIDIEALGLSRLAVLVIDLHQDVKGYSVLTLPQIRDEFWDVYKNYFHQRLLQGDTRICLFGPLPTQIRRKKKDHDA